METVAEEQHNGDAANNWEEWKASRSKIVYVNPDFIQNELSQEKREEISVQKKGPQTPPEPDVEVFFDEEIAEQKDALPEKRKEDGELEDDHPETDQSDKKEVSSPSPQPIVVKEEEKRSRSPQEMRSSRHRSRELKRRRSSSRGRARESKRRRSRSRSRRSRSSSRDTFDGIGFTSLPLENIRCNQCNRLFTSSHEVSVHELRSHDVRIPCAICAKVVLSPARLVNHTEKRHPSERVRCRFCNEKFGGKASDLTNAQWNDFREHTFRELLRRKTREYNRRSDESSALRGIGRCPHGPAIKCRNFPKCPGARCIYSHGRCDFSESCTNIDCPFDHPNRPRICMACVNDLKKRKRSRD